MADLLRLRAAFAAALASTPAPDACPSAERLHDAWHGLVPLPERAAIIDHIGRCGPCAEAWELAWRTPPPPQERRHAVDRARGSRSPLAAVPYAGCPPTRR